MSNPANAGTGFYATRAAARIQVSDVAGDERLSDVFGEGPDSLMWLRLNWRPWSVGSLGHWLTIQPPGTGDHSFWKDRISTEKIALPWGKRCILARPCLASVGNEVSSISEPSTIRCRKQWSFMGTFCDLR